MGFSNRQMDAQGQSLKAWAVDGLALVPTPITADGVHAPNGEATHLRVSLTEWMKFVLLSIAVVGSVVGAFYKMVPSRAELEAGISKAEKAASVVGRALDEHKIRQEVQESELGRTLSRMESKLDKTIEVQRAMGQNQAILMDSRRIPARRRMALPEGLDE